MPGHIFARHTNVLFLFSVVLFKLLPMKRLLTPESLHGRGTGANPKNRFDAYEYAPSPTEDEPRTAPVTQLFLDTTKSIIAKNDSPDIGFNAGINPYRGCEHGCIYCYARPTHEYLGFSAGVDFESKILVKKNAPELLRAALASPKWVPQVLALSGVTDAFQPIERKLHITRRCLQVLAEFRNPVVIITKNFLVTRDIDYLAELARVNAAAVIISITTLNAKLARIMEPRASHPSRRLEAIQKLAAGGIPAGVNIAPVIPGLTDEEIPAIVQAAVAAGASFAGMQPVRLPYGVKDLFSQWLGTHMPDRKDKVLNRIRAMRGDKLNDSRFGARMQGEGIFAEQIAGLFEIACRKEKILGNRPQLSTAQFRREPGSQMALF